MSVRYDPGHYTVTPRKPPRKPPPAPSYPTAELGGSQYEPPPRSPTQALVDAIAPVVSGGATGVPRRVATATPAEAALSYLAPTQSALAAHYLGTTPLSDLGPETALAALAPDRPAPNAATPRRRLDDAPFPSERSLTDALTKAAAQVGATAGFAAGRAQAGHPGPEYPNAVLGASQTPGREPRPGTVPPVGSLGAGPGAPPVAADTSKLAMRLSAAAGKSTPADALVQGFVDPVTGMKLSDSPYAGPIAEGAIQGQKRYGVPASVTLAVTGQESAYGTNRGPSTADAVGIGQGIPSTRESQLAAGGPDFWAGDNPANPTGNLTDAQAKEQTRAAAYLLGSSLDSGKSLTEALDSYTGGYGDVYNDPVNQRARAFAPLDKAQREPIPANLKQRAFDELGRGQSKQIIASARQGATPVQAIVGGGTPVPGRNPQIIGFPNQGTHTLGNWQSDNAIDIAVPTGTPIRAAEAGVVDKVDGNNSDPSSRFNGFAVTIGGNTFYTHLSQAKVQAGDRVKVGDVIGLSGAANGVEHLHFATESGNPQDLLSSGPPAAQAGPSDRALDRFIVPNESPQEVADELGVPVKKADIEVTKLSPELQRALVQLGRESGDPVSLSEGFRTRYRQEVLNTPGGGATGPAAAPGTSEHEAGQAVDVSLTPEQTALAGQFGLEQTVGGEPWHYEVATDEGFGSSATGSPAYGGASDTTTAATAGAVGAGATGGGVPAPSGPGAPLPTFAPAAALPFAARAALPGEYQGAGAEQDFNELLTGSSDPSELATKLASYQPRRRL